VGLKYTGCEAVSKHVTVSELREMRRAYGSLDYPLYHVY
jgi:hypothetical protein